LADSCSQSSLAAGESLAGTATEAERWLLVEAPGAWARDVAETELPPDARAAVDAFDGRVQLIKRPDRRSGERLAFVADSRDGTSRLDRVDASGDLTVHGPVHGTLVLVCCHGRRDPCCARVGTAVFDALRPHVAAEELWQSSHVGGHRFAANVLVLPAGILLGRVEPSDAAYVARELAAGRIPLGRYRGRTIHPPQAQAADAAVREHLGLSGIADVRVLSVANGRVRLATPAGELEAVVDARPGPARRESCGAASLPSVSYSVRW
jgi:hypothetical protein